VILVADDDSTRLMTPHDDSHDALHDRGMHVAPLGSSTRTSAACITLDGGAKVARHYHRRSDEVFVCVGGEGDLWVDGSHRALASGVAAVVPALSPHALVNRSARPLSLIVVSSPPFSDDDVYRG
jgi:mannose-6-phosphate isomerase-like protein (cupin superfamily)